MQRHELSRGNWIYRAAPRWSFFAVLGAASGLLQGVYPLDA